VVWRRPTLVVTAFFFKRYRHRASSSTFLCQHCLSLQDKFLHRCLEAVGILRSIPSWRLHSLKSCSDDSIRPYHVISIRPFIPSSHFVCFHHNILLSLGRASIQPVYCSSSGFRMCLSALLSEFSAGVNMSISICFCTPNCKLQIAFFKRDISGFRETRSLEHGSDTDTMTSSPWPPVGYSKCIFFFASPPLGFGCTRRI
jgi:hypothetical protein